MVRPSSFRMNSQTASNNYFQKNTNLNDAQVLEKACLEFDNLVSLLISNGIPVNVFQDDGMRVVRYMPYANPDVL